MSKGASIQAALERTVHAFRARPSSAVNTTTTRAVLREGFTTSTREGGHEFTADMPAAVGGVGSGPTPGVFGRACLSSCVAMGIRIAADRRGVAIDEIIVDLSMDWDSRGLFGLDGVSPGPANIGMNIELLSAAPESELRSIVAEGMQNDPWLTALTNPHTVQTDVVITAAA